MNWAVLQTWLDGGCYHHHIIRGYSKEEAKKKALDAKLCQPERSVYIAEITGEAVQHTVIESYAAPPRSTTGTV